MDISSRLWGITTEFVELNWPLEPRAEVICFRLNFKMPKLGYCTDFLTCTSNKQSSETDDVNYKLTSTAEEKKGETDLYMHLGIYL